MLTRMNPSDLPDARRVGYSQISIVPTGRLAFVSGQVAWDAKGATVADRIRMFWILSLENRSQNTIFLLQ